MQPWKGAKVPAALALSDLPATALQERGLFSRSLDLRSGSINETDRSFEAVVSTETPAVIWDRRTYDIIDEILIAKGGQFPERMPLLPNHQRHDVLDVIGSAVDFRLENNQWIGRGIIASPANDDDEVNKIWRRVADGHIRAVSIGYQVEDGGYVDIPAGSKASINGRTFEAGARTLRISEQWRVHELSLTPIGADELALIRSRLGGDAPRPQCRSYFR